MCPSMRPSNFCQSLAYGRLPMKLFDNPGWLAAGKNGNSPRAVELIDPVGMVLLPKAVRLAPAVVPEVGLKIVVPAMPLKLPASMAAVGTVRTVVSAPRL